MTTSSLESVSGLGQLSIEKLFKQFKSLEGIREASEEALSEVVGWSRARIIKDYFQKTGE
jgi:excinuclease ABC subunit C